MRFASIAVVLTALVALLAPCAHPPEHAGWTADWNHRVGSAPTPFEHPCATKAFIAWADVFLVGCVPARASSTLAEVEAEAEPVAFQPAPGCEVRVEWVEERVEQCRPWTAWQLRNFHKHERTEGSPPSMRIE
ncbi:MAG: hypothetical protein WEF50_10255 [Myxococcota bacterium]